MTSEPGEAGLPAGSMPVVGLPRARVSAVGIALGGSVGALLLFVALEHRRQAATEEDRAPVPPTSMIESPPPLTIPGSITTDDGSAVAKLQAAEVSAPSQFARPAQPFSASAQTPGSATGAEAPAPVPFTSPASSAQSDNGSPLVLDMGSVEGGQAGPAPASSSSGPTDAPGDSQPARATLIRNRAGLVPQGTLIPAVLETPIDSSRAGLARALVARDVRGFDGSRVLIPRGSRLIGEAKGDVQAGQSRVLVTWTRLIRPDGVAIRIASPGADNLGGAGLRGQVNNFFLERFANAVLQSALQIGINRASRPRDGVFVGIPGQLGAAVGQTPIFDVPSGPTVKVRQGAEIAIFVARDLDFGAIGNQ